MHSGVTHCMSHIMQLGVTSSARFASSAPRGNRSRIAPPWQLSHVTCNGATQLQVTPWNLALLLQILVWKVLFINISFKRVKIKNSTLTGCRSPMRRYNSRKASTVASGAVENLALCYIPGTLLDPFIFTRCVPMCCYGSWNFFKAICGAWASKNMLFLMQLWEYEKNMFWDHMMKQSIRKESSYQLLNLCIFQQK